MPNTAIDVSPELKQSAKRFGYVIAIGINLVMFFVVQNILEWGWLPFLTEEFAEVVPWISFSLIVSIAANLVYQVDDSPTVKSLGQIVVNLISIHKTVIRVEVPPKSEPVSAPSSRGSNSFRGGAAIPGTTRNRPRSIKARTKRQAHGLSFGPH